jgi:transcriptional regulator with XRE-family HTH domain
MLELSQEEMSLSIDIDKKTITRIENDENYPTNETLEKIYNYAYKKGIKINKIKEMMYKEENPKSKIIFHGSKNIIEGEISSNYGRANNDFGNGFYCGESIEQTTSFVSRFQDSSIYILKFDNKNLKCEFFDVDQEWMLAVAYFRGKLKEYENNEIIKNIIEKVKNSDYVIAPIADNRMFRIIDRFIDGEITDEQCKHCLAATNLGNQYVFLTEKATSKISILERCYIARAEREFYYKQKEEDVNDSDNKVKFALIKYKREGKYIEEILK